MQQGKYKVKWAPNRRKPKVDYVIARGAKLSEGCQLKKKRRNETRWNETRQKNKKYVEKSRWRRRKNLTLRLEITYAGFLFLYFYVNRCRRQRRRRWQWQWRTRWWASSASRSSSSGRGLGEWDRRREVVLRRLCRPWQSVGELKWNWKLSLYVCLSLCVRVCVSMMKLPVCRDWLIKLFSELAECDIKPQWGLPKIGSSCCWKGVQSNREYC